MIHVLRMNDCFQKQWLRYTSIRAPLLKCAPSSQFAHSLLRLSISIHRLSACASQLCYVCVVLMHIFVCNALVLSITHSFSLIGRRMWFAAWSNASSFCSFCRAFFEYLMPLFLLVFTLYISLSFFLYMHAFVYVQNDCAVLFLARAFSFSISLVHASFLALFQWISAVSCTPKSFHFNICGSRTP